MNMALIGLVLTPGSLLLRIVAILLGHAETILQLEICMESCVAPISTCSSSHCVLYLLSEAGPSADSRGVAAKSTASVEGSLEAAEQLGRAWRIQFRSAAALLWRVFEGPGCGLCKPMTINTASLQP